MGLSVLSVLLCVATVIVWARSYWCVTFAARYARWFGGDVLRTEMIELREGRVLFIHSVWSRGGDAKCEYAFHDEHTWGWNDGQDVEHTCFGFGWLSVKTPPDMVDSSLKVASLPCWLVFGCTLGTATYVARRALSGARTAGRCRRCGYDLRATPDRCPECGTVPRRVAGGLVGRHVQTDPPPPLKGS